MPTIRSANFSPDFPNSSTRAEREPLPLGSSTLILGYLVGRVVLASMRATWAIPAATARTESSGTG